MLTLASVNVLMRPSPARNVAPEPASWIPIESLSTLPELEELLDPKNLVDSGQSKAVRIGQDGKGYVFVDSDMKKSLEKEKIAKRESSHRRWSSRRRTLHLKKRAKLHKIFVVSSALALAILVTSGFTIFRPAKANARPLNPVSSFMPTVVPVVVEGKNLTILSVANSLKQFQDQHGLTDMVSMQDDFDRRVYAEKRSMPALEFRHRKVLTLSVDAKTVDIKSNALTVGELLEENNVVVGGNDVVTPALKEKLQGITTVSITRVSTTIRTEDRIVPFTIEKRSDSSLAKGRTIIKQAGVNGQETVTITQTLQDGNVASEVISSRTVIKSPVNKVVLVGTRNPARQSGKASWYSHVPGTCAHKTLPFGTIVTVTNTSNGKTTSCRVADRGPFGGGRVVDLSKDVFAKIASTSQGVVPVTLSW